MAYTIISIILLFWLILAYVFDTPVKTKIKPTERTINLLLTVIRLSRDRSMTGRRIRKTPIYPTTEQPRDELGRFKAKVTDEEFQEVRYYREKDGLYVRWNQLDENKNHD